MATFAISANSGAFSRYLVQAIVCDALNPGVAQEKPAEKEQWGANGAA